MEKQQGKVRGSGRNAESTESTGLRKSCDLGAENRQPTQGEPAGRQLGKGRPQPLPPLPPMCSHQLTRKAGGPDAVFSRWWTELDRRHRGQIEKAQDTLPAPLAWLTSMPPSDLGSAVPPLGTCPSLGGFLRPQRPV